MQITPILPPREASAAPRSGPAPDDPLYLRAQQLEAAFLAEMLGLAGLGETEGAFGGGIGEEQFSSFLRQEQAQAIVARGGIGLAESLFLAMGGGNDAA